VDIESVLGQIVTRASRDFPLVSIGFKVPVNNDGTIIVDLQESMRLITNHLIEKGRKKIAYIGESSFEHDSLAKYAGFITETSRAKLDVNRDLVISGCSDFAGGYAAAEKILSAGKPDAIVAETDTLAIGCMRYLLKQGIRIPQDIAVTGFDDIPLSEIFDPPITTARIPVDVIAEQGVKMLVAKMRNEKPVPSAHNYCEIIYRAST
jgi:DNA-binding LacI/PurR family transcriptional regulator